MKGLATPKELIAALLKISVKDLKEEHGPYAHPAWDSLTHVKILLELELSYGLDLSNPNVHLATTVRELLSFIKPPSLPNGP